MIIDLHADTPLWQRWLGYDFCRAHRPWLPAGAWLSNVDLPRMAEAGMAAQVFGLVALPIEAGLGYNSILRQIAHVEASARRASESFTVVRTAMQYANAESANKRIGLLSIEGVHTLRGRLERASELIERGVVSFGLAHFHANEACRPAFGLGFDSARGLTPFGHELVRFLASRQVILDLAHINRAGFFDAIATTAGPVMVSHTGVKGVYAHWRNIDDAQIRAIADKGGIVGIIFSRHFLGGDDVDAVVAHIEHLVDVGGEACAALGSDFDGFIVPVRGLRDVRGYGALRAALARRGMSQTIVDGIMGRNARAFLLRALP